MRPVVFLSNPREQCVTFFWKEHPQYTIGYRFLESTPVTYPEPAPEDASCPTCRQEGFPETGETSPEAGIALPEGKNWYMDYTEENPADPFQLSFRTFSDGSARCKIQENGGAQEREMFFRPAADGAWMWLKMTTREEIPGSFLVQQCLRFTGTFNAEWRQEVAHIPLLSELDMQAAGRPNATLTYVRQGEKWLSFPVQHTVFSTILQSSGAPLDHGLILRESVSKEEAPAAYWSKFAAGVEWRQVSAGMYWERTARVSNRHPADCLHADVDFGPLHAGQSRILHGRFYFLEGAKDELLQRFHRDFPITRSIKDDQHIEA
jgi:hypothetical protein